MKKSREFETPVRNAGKLIDILRPIGADWVELAREGRKHEGDKIRIKVELEYVETE